jgi:hypothetical protein
MTRSSERSAHSAAVNSAYDTTAFWIDILHRPIIGHSCPRPESTVDKSPAGGESFARGSEFRRPRYAGERLRVAAGRTQPVKVTAARELTDRRADGRNRTG